MNKNISKYKDLYIVIPYFERSSALMANIFCNLNLGIKGENIIVSSCGYIDKELELLIKSIGVVLIKSKSPFSIGERRHEGALIIPENKAILFLDVDCLPTREVLDISIRVLDEDACIFIKPYRENENKISRGCGISSINSNRYKKLGDWPFGRKRTWGRDDILYKRKIKRNRIQIIIKKPKGFIHLFHSKEKGSFYKS